MRIVKSLIGLMFLGVAAAGVLPAGRNVSVTNSGFGDHSTGVDKHPSGVPTVTITRTVVHSIPSGAHTHTHTHTHTRSLVSVDAQPSDDHHTHLPVSHSASLTARPSVARETPPVPISDGEYSTTIPSYFSGTPSASSISKYLGTPTTAPTTAPQ